MSKKNSTGGSPTSPSPSSFIQAQLGGWRNRKKFGKVYTEFKINASSGPLAWSLFRRYTEFCDLHKQLQQQFPTVRLPTLPGSKLFGRLEKEFLNKRKSDLAEYLHLLLCHDRFSNSAALLVFLGAMSHVHDPATPVSNLPYQLHIDKIVEIAHHGDVVLFHTAGVLQSVQRSVTGSNYDHVGIILRTPLHSKNPLSLYILEATSDGVKKYPMVRRLKAWSISNATVVYRQLTMDRTESNFEPLQRFSDFADSVDGKPYGISAATLLKATLTAQTQKTPHHRPERGVLRPLDTSAGSHGSTNGSGSGSSSSLSSGGGSPIASLTSVVLTFVGLEPEKKDAEGTDLDRSGSRIRLPSPTSPSPTSLSLSSPTSPTHSLTNGFPSPTSTTSSTTPTHHSNGSNSSNGMGHSRTDSSSTNSNPEQQQGGGVGLKPSSLKQPLLDRKSSTTEEEKERKLEDSKTSSTVDKQEKYFCSELVACCYQILGLLPVDVPASDYLPSSFAEEGDTALKTGAKLGREILIVFKKPEVETAVDLDAEGDEESEGEEGGGGGGGGGGLETSKRHKGIKGRECTDMCYGNRKGSSGATDSSEEGKEGKRSPPLSPLTSPLPPPPPRTQHHRIRSRSKSLNNVQEVLLLSSSSCSSSNPPLRSSPQRNSDSWLSSSAIPSSPAILKDPFEKSASTSHPSSSSSAASSSSSPASLNSSKSASPILAPTSLRSTPSPINSRSPSPLPPLPTSARPTSKSGGGGSSTNGGRGRSPPPVPLSRATSNPNPSFPPYHGSRIPSSPPLPSIPSFDAVPSDDVLLSDGDVETRSRATAPMYHLLGQLIPQPTIAEDPETVQSSSETNSSTNLSSKGTRANRTFTTTSGIMVLD